MNLAKGKIKYIFSYIIVAIGTFLMAIAINLIFEPLSMVTGGFSGIAIIVKDVTQGIVKGGIPIGVTTTLLNIPLFLLAVKQRGFRGMLKILYGMSCFSLALFIVPTVAIIQKDYLMGSFLGGGIMGVGLALVFSQRMSTGGTDLLSLLLQKWFPNLSIAKILLFVDGIIVISGASLFGLQSAMYAVVAVFVATKIMDGIMEGLSFAKQVQIITNYGDEIGKRILVDVERGVTRIPGMGMYTGEERDILMCILSRNEVPHINKIVHEIDPDAFVIVSDIREVSGEGFIKNGS